jgi:hypothetical protein
MQETIMENKIKVGDRVLNVEYLKYIGNSEKWLDINMQPFETVLGVDECTPWNKTVTCFSVYHSDVKGISRIPMDRNKIFDIDTGFDMDRQLGQFLSVSSSKEEIKMLVKSSVEANIEKRNKYSNERIADAERQIIALKKEIKDHTAFCNECGDYIINKCDEI